MANEPNQKEKTKKLPLSKENPTFYKILIAAGIITVLLQTILKGSGGMADAIAQALGAMGALILATWIIGIIPVLIFRKKINNARIKIYGVIFLLFCALVIIGTITSN